MRSISILKALGLVGALASTGCFMEPYDGQVLGSSPTADVKMTGFAQKQGATINLQARRKDTGQWVTFATATSSLQTTYGGQTLYYFNRYAPIYDPADPDTKCFFHAGCFIPAGGATVQLRAVEVGGSLSTLVSFEQGGIACVQEKVDDGVDWFAAGWDCRGKNSPIVNVRYIF